MKGTIALDQLKRYPSVEKPWLQFFSEEAKNAEVPKETIYTSLCRRNKGFESNYALNFVDHRITFGHLMEQANVAAAAFEKLGVKPGDVVACASITMPEMVYSMYGLNKIGATILMLDPRRSNEEILDLLNSSKARVLLVMDLFYDKLKEAIEEAKLDHLIIISPDASLTPFMRLVKRFKVPTPKIPEEGKTIHWKTFAATGSTSPDDSYTAPYGENDCAAITMTGGTTGLPKGVMLSNLGFSSVTTAFENCGVRYTREQSFLDIIPAFASYGIVASLHMPLCLGVEVVTIPKFDPEKVGHYIKKYRPAHTLMVPAHYEKLMYSKEMRNGFDLSFFETAGSGGDTMNAGTEAKLNGFLKEHGSRFPLSQGYGMSEVSSAGSCYCNGNFRSLSVGYPLLTNTISIFKPETTEELSYNEEGEICFTGPGNMLGYLDNPEETENVMKLHPDGKVWIHSGDVGYMDEDGFLYIKGRIKRMITRADGHKVFPVQLESIFGKHEDVEACAVVGVKDPDSVQGDVPILFVKLIPGADREKAEKELKALYNKVELRAMPYDMVLLDEMPREGMGKIAYQQLSDMYVEMLEQAEAV
ncbi:MAG: acyl--CoA ligase [Clostridia bacterium]|nr:acyl--CoA ligase [Clostridia bacterium]